MTTHEISISLQDGMHFTANQEDGQVIHLDAGAEYGGQGLGARPQPLMLVSLAACTGMDVITILRKKRQDVTDFSVSVTAEKAETHPKIYTQIAVHYTVTGNDVDPAALERAIDLSINKYCPVAGLLIKAVPIETSYKINAA